MHTNKEQLEADFFSWGGVTIINHFCGVLLGGLPLVPLNRHDIIDRFSVIGECAGDLFFKFVMIYVCFYRNHKIYCSYCSLDFTTCNGLSTKSIFDIDIDFLYFHKPGLDDNMDVNGFYDITNSLWYFVW
jgi:hypothetical protein